MFVVIAMLGCAARQQQPASSHEAVIHQGRYRVWIKGATVAPRRPDGSPWHISEPDDRAVVAGAVAGLAVGNPELGVAVGERLAGTGGDALAPMPFVRVKLAGTTWTIGPATRTYSPTWPDAIAIDAHALRGDEKVVIQVIDAVDEALLAQGQLTVAELVARPGQTLTNLRGSVPSLDVEVTLENWLDRVEDDDFGAGD